MPLPSSIDTNFVNETTTETLIYCSSNSAIPLQIELFQGRMLASMPSNPRGYYRSQAITLHYTANLDIFSKEVGKHGLRFWQVSTVIRLPGEDIDPIQMEEEGV